MKFIVGNRELDFDPRSKEITYDGMVFAPTSIRTYSDMKDLYSEDNLEDNFPLYYMYRDVYFSEDDKKVFKENKLRYDITVIVPKIVGDEYNKTYGHFHPTKQDGKKYEEIYEVLEGNAIYLQQNEKEVFYTTTIPGDKVVMKEGFGHVTINPSGSEVLIMANVVDDTFESEYNEYKTLKGGNYLYTDGGWKINENYNNFLEIKEDYDKFEGIMNIYDDFLATPEKFNFLH